MQISISNLSHTYDGTHRVFHGISFELRDGTALALTGPSGSGKSTLMNCLSLLLKPTGGSMLFDGVDVMRLSETQKAIYRLNHIGMIRQDLALLPHRTALDNVIVPLLLQGGISKRGALDRGKEALAMVQLESHIHSPVGKLSGGERQRVAIARAMVNRPKLVLADEPTAQLDADSSKRITELLLRLATENGALMMATHDLNLMDFFEDILPLR